jgi:hypothetical protein
MANAEILVGTNVDCPRCRHRFQANVPVAVKVEAVGSGRPLRFKGLTGRDTD